MTEDFVSFEASAEGFETSGPLGYLLLEKDNPSDDPSLSCSTVIPVRFQ